MTKGNYEFHDQEMLDPKQEIMKEEVVEPKPFESSVDFYVELIASSKPTPPQKPKRLDIGPYDEKTCSSSSQKQSANVTAQAAKEECNKTFAEKKEFFEQLAGNHKPKGKVATYVEQINQNGLSSNAESKCTTVSIEEIEQVCGRKR